jgi:hypothetical protein
VPRTLILLPLLALWTVVPAAQTSDLDAFMSRVLASRDENWKKLQQYILEEQETLQVLGPGGLPIYGFRREYAWFVRQGFFIRSPLKADGVTIGEAERRRAEDQWMEREKRRDLRRTEREGAQPAATTEDILRQTVEPGFVSAAYFLRFRFDPGHYALAGRERLDGRDVLRIEYYPTKLFNEGRTRPNRQVRDRDDQVEEKMNKASLVTLWVEPSAHQILQYDFDNIDMDFLPGRSLVRVDGLKATMRMGQPFEGVWLPRSIGMQFDLTMALGAVKARYDVEYRDYKLPSVTTNIR